MASWSTLRIFFLVLLLIPILHAAFLLSQEVAANLNSSPTAWEEEVNAYTAKFRDIDLPENPVIVIGGRRVQLWRGLEHILSPRPVLMLGVGNATVDDITHYHSQLVAHFRPSAVVLFPGNSEFHLRDNKSAPELVASIRKLIELDQSYGLRRQYYILAPIKSPLYPADYPRIDETVRLLQGWVGSEPTAALLNGNPLLSQKNGLPNPDFFRMDGSNLNEHGYLRLSLLLQGGLAQDVSANSRAASSK